MYGQKIGNMKANGLTIKCMEREGYSGTTEESMRVIIEKTKSTGLAYFNGLTEESISEIGVMESSKGEASMFLLKAKKKLVNGMTAKGYDGLKIFLLCQTLEILSNLSSRIFLFNSLKCFSSFSEYY